MSRTVAAFAAALLLAEVTVRRVPAVAQRLGDLSAAIAARLGGRAADPARQIEDDAYASADRWATEEARFAEEEKLRAASMNQAARLYIARLRGGGGGAPPR